MKLIKTTWLDFKNTKMWDKDNKIKEYGSWMMYIQIKVIEQKLWKPMIKSNVVKRKMYSTAHR